MTPRSGRSTRVAGHPDRPPARGGTDGDGRGSGLDPAAVARRVLAGLDRLVEDLIAAYAAEVPEYAALGPEVLRSEVRPVSREIVRAFFAAVAEGRHPEPDGVASLRDMGARRLEMGIPLEPMLHVYRVAARRTWEAVVAAAGVPGAPLLGDLAAAWMDYMDRASSIAAAGYLEASHERLRRLDARRGALFELLLAATDSSDVAALAAGAGVTFADRYRPVVAAGPSVTGRVDRLLADAPVGTISGFRGGALVLLTPPEAPPPLPVAGLVLAVGDPAVCGPELATAVGETVRLAEAALLARGGPPAAGAVVGPGDHVVERAVLGDAWLRRRLLRDIVEPLRAADRHGTLTETLDVFLRTGSVPATAEIVCAHPNTVAYRLRRVAEVTGRDPRTPRGAAVLLMARTAEQVEAGTADPSRSTPSAVSRTPGRPGGT